MSGPANNRYHIHLIIADWITKEDVYYTRVSPDDSANTSRFLHKISGDHQKSIGIEAVWVGKTVTGQVGDSGSDPFTGFQSFWAGAKKKIEHNNGQNAQEMTDLTFFVSPGLISTTPDNVSCFMPKYEKL